MISFDCPNCRKSLRVKEELAGKKIRCPNCKQTMAIPAGMATAPAADAAKPSFADDATVPPRPMSMNQDATVPPPPAEQNGAGDVDLSHKVLKAEVNYGVEGEIARGGMGAIMRAFDQDIRREVAVKFLLNSADARLKARFVEEAQITGQLEHPNIVPIHQLGLHDDGRCFFSMKMVKGRTLADILKEARKEDTPGRLLTIFVSICNAMAYAHSHKVIHRDLKPANVMVGDFGEVYVMDWGLAKVLGKQGPPTPAVPSTAVRRMKPPADATQPGTGFDPKVDSKISTARENQGELTQAGAIMGTAAYMPPEQAEGDPARVDERSDIYSLGAILYEIMTLTPPVGRDGDMMTIIMRVVAGQIELPARRAPARVKAGWISPELSAIAMKALATNPDDRYQTVENLRMDIQRFQEGRSVTAKQDSFWEMFTKLVKRNKGVSTATAAATVVLLVVAGIFLKINYDARVEAESQRTIAQKALADFEQEQKDKQERTREAVPALIVTARQVANAGPIKDALKHVDLALLYDAENADAHLLKGQILLGLREWANARTELEKYVEKKPADADAKHLLSLCSTGKVNDAVTQYAVADLLSRLNLPGPAIPLLKQVAAAREKRQHVLPIYQKQIETAWKGFGGRLSLEQNGQLLLRIGYSRNVNTLEPLKGMQLERIEMMNTPVADLTPLKGMPLTYLDLANCIQVRDLTPLKGMPLTHLNLHNCPLVHDLTPLQGMLLTFLSLQLLGELEDLTPLKGMPLTFLSLDSCYRVRDLSPLQGMPLTTLLLNVCRKVSDLTPLKGMPLTNLQMHYCQMSDLTPLQGMPLTTLKILNCFKVTDLTPLQGMKLTEFTFTPKAITKGIDVLREMKSLARINDMRAAEFWEKYEAGEFKK